MLFNFANQTLNAVYIFKMFIVGIKDPEPWLVIEMTNKETFKEKFQSQEEAEERRNILMNKINSSKS